jgi:hypothetical protein
MSGDHNQYQKDQFPDTTKMMYEWVGLTDKEIAEGAKQSWVDKQAFESAVWWAEAKLKEKNAYGWQSVSNPTEYLDELRGGTDT